MIRRAPCSVWLEANTDTQTLHFVVEVNAADGEGDVTLYRLDLSAALAGTANAEKRRKLRALFATT